MMACENCAHNCRQGRDCPDHCAPARGIVLAVIVGMCFWSLVVWAFVELLDYLR